MKKLSVVVPLFNEQDGVDELIGRLSAVLDTIHGWHAEIIVVDDGSTDATVARLYTLQQQEKRLIVVALSRNFGHQAAVTAGLDHATGDAVVVMDGDLQDPPECIPALLHKHEEGFDVVYAVRRKRKEGVLKRFAYYLFYRVLHRLSRQVPIPQDAGDFALMSRRVVLAMAAMPERNRFVRGLRAWVGFSQIGVSYERDARYAGTPKYSFTKLLRLAYDGIFSFSYVPITIVSIVGIVSSFVAFCGIGIVLYFRFVDGREVPGFAATAVIILFFAGLQLMALGAFGEYIRRIYDEVKQRPHYVVRGVRRFNVK